MYMKSIILLALSGLLIGVCHIAPEHRVSDSTGVYLQLPNEIGDFHGSEIEKTFEEKKQLPPSTLFIRKRYKHYLSSTLQAKRIENFTVSLVVSGGDERSLHRPDVCLDGLGWTVVTKTIHNFEINGKVLPVMDYSLAQTVENSEGKKIKFRAHYYFLWIGRDVNTASLMEMKWLSLWDNFTKNLNHRWAYPGVFLSVNEAQDDPEADALKRSKGIFNAIIPYFHKEFGAQEIGVNETAPEK